MLDFGKAILLTDVVIPMCGDLASLSIDIWIQGEEIDGHRLVVSGDIGISSLIMNDIMPPPVCRYLKVILSMEADVKFCNYFCGLHYACYYVNFVV